MAAPPRMMTITYKILTTFHRIMCVSCYNYVCLSVYKIRKEHIDDEKKKENVQNSNYKTLTSKFLLDKRHLARDIQKIYI